MSHYDGMTPSEIFREAVRCMAGADGECLVSIPLRAVREAAIMLDKTTEAVRGQETVSDRR